MSKALDALDKLFESVEEDIGPSASAKLTEALGEAKSVLDEERATEVHEEPPNA